MKLGIAIYHSNIQQYPEDWVQKCLFSIYGQRPREKWQYFFYELNYGDTKGQISITENYRHKPLKNYAAAMNEIYQWIFETCDAVANTNIDDWYNPVRLTTLLKEIEKKDVDIVSSNYYVVSADGHTTFKKTEFDGLDVCLELKNGNNIVSNPAHILKKRVFEKCKLDPMLVPIEDLDYWQRCCKCGFKIKIVPEYLHYYRNHPGQEGNRR